MQKSCSVALYVEDGEIRAFCVTMVYKMELVYIGQILKAYNIFIKVMMLNNIAVYSDKKWAE